MKSGLVVIALFLLIEGVLAREADQEGTVALFFENDLFAGTDKHETHGTRIAWLSGAQTLDKVPLWAAWLGKAVPEEGSFHYGWSLQQELFTPADTESPVLVTDDRPFAGLAAVGFSAHRVTPRRITSIEGALGWVGPAALGEETQRAAHRLEGTDEPVGWDHQLGDEPTLNVAYTMRWRVHEPRHTWSWDLVPQLGVDLGNRITQAHGTVWLRFGKGLPWGLTDTHMGSASYQGAHESNATRVYGFIGLQGRAIAHDITLDGNSFRESHRVDREPLVGEAFAGLRWCFRGWSLSYTHAVQSEAFRGQSGANYRGSVALSMTF